ncbi:hypothetical protein [Salinimicrobium marinum]|nr:hypothetical protein [Salinimicrobium marinum]
MKNTTLRYFFLVVSTFFMIGCSSDDNEEKSFGSGPLALTVGTSENNCEILKIKCPVGAVCDENFIYRAYSFEDRDLRIYISFDPDVVDNYSLESLRENFNYINFSILFPEKATADSRFYYSNRNPVRELGTVSEEGVEFTMDSYENGVLKGVITGTINEITEAITSDDPDCMTGDIAGRCFESHEVNIPFSVVYSFCLE